MSNRPFVIIVWIAIATGIQAYAFHDAKIRFRQDISPIDTMAEVDPTNPTTPFTGPTTTANPTGPTNSTTANPTGPTNSTTANPFSTTQPPVVQAGGSAILNAGDIRRVSSTGFGTGYNNGGEILTWQFLANNCRLDATCPCVGIPASWNCLAGYLQIRTGILWDNQKFCGGNRPSNFTSDTGEISIKYKSSSDPRSTGFTCFISCTTYGQMRAPLPSVTC